MSAETEALAAALEYGHRADKTIELLKHEMRQLRVKYRSVSNHLEEIKRLARFDEQPIRNEPTDQCNEAAQPSRPDEMCDQPVTYHELRSKGLHP